MRNPKNLKDEFPEWKGFNFVLEQVAHLLQNEEMTFNAFGMKVAKGPCEKFTLERIFEKCILLEVEGLYFV